MRVTGQPTIMDAVQKKTVTEFVKVLPLIFIFIACVLFFHRTLKLVIISLVPMLYAVLLTFGILGIFHGYLVLAHQIILIAPLLVAFGIGDSLYVANRFAEERIEDYRNRVIHAVRSVEKAILLTSVTTSVGFGSLMIGTIKPLFSIGLALAIGIMLCYLLSITLVPCLILILKYRKRYKLKSFKGFGMRPIRNRKKILGMGGMIAIISLALCLPAIRFSANYYLMAPQDEPSVQQMQEYSKEFDAGQPGMIIVRGDANDYRTLAAIDKTEGRTRETTPETTLLSVVDLMKAVQPNRTKILELAIEYYQESPLYPSIMNLTGGLNVSGAIQNITLEKNRSFWWWISEGPIVSGSPKARSEAIRGFYSRMSYEMRSVLLSEDEDISVNEHYWKTLLMVDMPVMSIYNTREVVEDVNDAVDHYGTIEVGSSSHLTGMAALLVAVNDLMVWNQFVTLLAAVMFCFIMLALALRSIKYAGITVLPVCFVVLCEPIAFVCSNVELSLITMMIGAIIIGVGIDFSIHLTHKVQEKKLAFISLSKATEGVGISFIETTVTMLAGLSAALIVPIPSVREFILMIMLLLVISLLAALFILPALYSVWIKWKETE